MKIIRFHILNDGYSMEETLIPEYHMFDFETLVGRTKR